MGPSVLGKIVSIVLVPGISGLEKYSMQFAFLTLQLYFSHFFLS